MQFIDRSASGGATSGSIRNSASARRETPVDASRANGEALYSDPLTGAAAASGHGIDAAPAFLNLKTPVLQSLFGSAEPVPNWPANPPSSQGESEEDISACGWQWLEPKF